MNSTHPRPDFWTRLGRAFVVFFKVVLLLLVVAAIGLGAWYGYQEISRSLAAINDRATVSTERIDLLRDDVDTLMSDTADAEALATLQAQVVALEAQAEVNDTALASDLEEQQAALTGLQLQVAGLITSTAPYSQEIALLQRGLSALQEDLNTNSEMVDALGGSVDQVEADMAALEGEFAAVRADAGELAEMERALSLFRVWELLSRARLYLSQGNAGLAQGDVAIALATVDGLLAEDTTADNASTDPALAELRRRLALAAENLPDAPAVAGRDLETAWETLDQILVPLVGIPEVEATVPLTATRSLTSTGTITATTPVTTTSP